MWRGDLCDAVGKRQLRGTIGQLYSAIGILLPGRDDDSDVHGHGYVGEPGKLHIQGHCVESMHDHLSGRSNGVHRTGSDAVRNGSDLSGSDDDWGRVRDSDLQSSIGVVLPGWHDYSDVHDIRAKLLV